MNFSKTSETVVGPTVLKRRDMSGCIPNLKNHNKGV